MPRPPAPPSRPPLAIGVKPRKEYAHARKTCTSTKALYGNGTEEEQPQPPAHVGTNIKLARLALKLMTGKKENEPCSLPYRFFLVGQIFMGFVSKHCRAPRPRRVSRATGLYLAALDGAACRVSAHSGDDPWRKIALALCTTAPGAFASCYNVPHELTAKPAVVSSVHVLPQTCDRRRRLYPLARRCAHRPLKIWLVPRPPANVVL